MFLRHRCQHRNLAHSDIVFIQCTKFCLLSNSVLSYCCTYMSLLGICIPSINSSLTVICLLEIETEIEVLFIIAMLNVRLLIFWMLSSRLCLSEVLERLCFLQTLTKHFMSFKSKVNGHISFRSLCKWSPADCHAKKFSKLPKHLLQYVIPLMLHCVVFSSSELSDHFLVMDLPIRLSSYEKSGMVW
jgi:hypothetical protein